MAYAAWGLLLRCVDRRAYVWIHTRPDEFEATTERGRRRTVHAKLNIEALKRAMKDPEKKLSEQFLDRKIMNGMGPWVTLEDCD